MADKSAQRKLAKQIRSGTYAKSSVGAKARAAATRLKGKHANPDSKPEPRVDSPARGKHRYLASDAKGKHRLTDSLSVSKNNRGSLDAPSTGKHSREAAMSRKIEASKPPKPQGQGIGSIKEAVMARKKVRSR